MLLLWLLCGFILFLGKQMQHILSENNCLSKNMWTCYTPFTLGGCLFTLSQHNNTVTDARSAHRAKECWAFWSVWACCWWHSCCKIIREMCYWALEEVVWIDSWEEVVPHTTVCMRHHEAGGVTVAHTVKTEWDPHANQHQIAWRKATYTNTSWVYDLSLWLCGFDIYSILAGVYVCLMSPPYPPYTHCCWRPLCPFRRFLGMRAVMSSLVL